MKNVLVTGATTPLGAAIVRRLLAQADTRVLAVGREVYPVQLPALGPRLEYHIVELTRARALHDLLWGPARAAAVDAVVHAAWHRGADDEPGARELHVEISRAMLQIAARHPTIRRLVHLSHAEVYRLDEREPNLLGEDAPLELAPGAPERVRQRVEADVAVALGAEVARAHGSPLAVTILRLAEIFAPASGSQLWDYLGTRLCLRPLGFDPMINLLDPHDAADAVARALASPATGIFNIPGADTLPLSALVARAGRVGLPVPGPFLSPLYRLRRRVVGREFRYDLNASRFHFGGQLDGRRAREVLGYVPTHRLVFADAARAA